MYAVSFEEACNIVLSFIVTINQILNKFIVNDARYQILSVGFNVLAFC